MNQQRKLTMTAGLLYLATFATSIPALALKTPFLEHGTHSAQATWAAALEIVLALCCVGTAVTLYPVLRSRNEALSLGFVASRTLEAALVVLGVVALLALVSLPAEGGAGRIALVEVHRWAFLIGPGFMPAVNAGLLATVLLRHRLVPRAIPLIGLFGAPLLAASATATLFGVLDQVSALAGLAALPIAAWEFSIGVWLTVRGVRTLTPDEVAAPDPNVRV